MVHFVGAGPGAPDLITVRGARLIAGADVVIYAGSLVNPALLGLCGDGAVILNSAAMTLEEVFQKMKEAEEAGRSTVRLHTGDPCLYGAIREQMDLLAAAGIPYDDTPGVSSFCGAAAALETEYTLPGISQSVIITRLAGRTPVPERESLRALASHGATMVIFLSAGMTEKVSEELLLGGAYTKDTPAAIVYKATWPEEKIVHCTVGTLGVAARAHGINKTALILVGDFLTAAFEGVVRSENYAQGAGAANGQAGERTSDDGTTVSDADAAHGQAGEGIPCDGTTVSDADAAHGQASERTSCDGATVSDADAAHGYSGKGDSGIDDGFRTQPGALYERSRLYDPSFHTEYRKNKESVRSDIEKTAELPRHSN